MTQSTRNTRAAWSTARALLITTLFVGASALRVSAQSMSGSWLVDYPTKISGGDGEANIDEMGHADVMFVQTADTIRGIWHTQGSEKPSRHVSGTLKGTHLSLMSEPFEAQTHGGNGEAIMVRVFYEGEVRNARISGTMRVRAEDGSAELAPVKWSAQRVPAPPKHQ